MNSIGHLDDISCRYRGSTDKNSCPCRCSLSLGCKYQVPTIDHVYPLSVIKYLALMPFKTFFYNKTTTSLLLVVA